MSSPILQQYARDQARRKEQEQLQRQQAIAKEALAKKQITQAQYDSFVANNKTAVYTKPAPSSSAPSPKASNPPQQQINSDAPSPVPSNPANPYMVDTSGKVWVKQGYDVKTDTVTVPAKITAEEKQGVLAEVAKVASMPESNEEAIALGKDKYIPKAQKEAYYKQVDDYFNQKQTQTIYTITPKPQPQGEQGSKSLSERMLDVQVTPLIGANTVSQLTNLQLGGRAPKSAPNRPLAPFAGFVASAESLVYSVGALVGVKDLPVPPPTVSSGLVGKGVQGVAALVGVNAQSNELETVMTNPRYGGAYAVGTVFGDVLTGFGVGTVAKKGIQAGGKVVSVVAPKIDLAAESVLARSTRFAEASVNRVRPGYGQALTSIVKGDAAKMSVTLDATEAKLNQAVVKPVLNLKYGQAANKTVDAAVSLKDKAVTVGQRAADIAMPAGNSEPDLFMRAVVKPNLKNYSKVTDTTAKLYGERIATSETLGDLKLATATPLKEASQNIVDTAKLAATYQKVVVAPKLGIRATAKEAKNLASPLIGDAKQDASPKAFKEFWGNIERDLREVNRRIKVSNDPYGTKAVLSKLSKSNLEERQVAAIRRNMLNNEASRVLQDSNVKSANKIASQLTKEQAKLELAMAKKTSLGKSSFGNFWKTVEGKPKVPVITKATAIVNDKAIRVINKVQPRKISNAITGKNLLKENIDPTKLTGMSRGAKQTAVFELRFNNIRKAVRGEGKATATKNISDFEALRMAKKVSRGSKARTIKQLQDAMIKEPQIKMDSGIAKSINNDATLNMKASRANPMAVQLKRESTEVSKNIAGGMPKAVNAPYPKTRITRSAEEEETTYLTFPKETLKINKPAISSINIVNDVTGITHKNPTANINRIFKEDNKINTKSKQTNDLLPTITPDYTQGFKPIQDSFTKEVLKQPTATKPLYETTGITKTITDTKITPIMPTFNLGGGFGESTGGSAFSGKWFKKKHKIKTPAQMLATFGVKTGTKSRRHRGKNFKSRRITKSKRRRKR